MKYHIFPVFLIVLGSIIGLLSLVFILDLDFQSLLLFGFIIGTLMIIVGGVVVFVFYQQSPQELINEQPIVPPELNQQVPSYDPAPTFTTSQMTDMAQDDLHTQQSAESTVKADNLTIQLVNIVDKWSNSFWHFTIPNKLLSNSIIISITEKSENTISAVLMYGERRGELGEVPYDHSGLQQKFTDLAQESLWLYDSEETEQIPAGFQLVKQPPLYIPTGQISKCHKCRGHGRVECWYCGGSGSVKREESMRTYWEPCSLCAGGFVECEHCTGYGWTQVVVQCTTEYKTSTTQNFEYDGSVPRIDLMKVAGRTLFEEIVDYPQSIIRKMLVGGININEYMQLQGIIKDKLYNIITRSLTTYEGDLRIVYDLVDRFFDVMPNPVKANKLLEYEILPVRLQVKVTRKPVYRIAYTYKSEPYELWVYGRERKIYASKRPSKFTNRGIILFGVVSALIIVAMAVIFIIGIVILLNLPLVGL